MKIEQLAAYQAKIGKTSITLKDENGKTAGVITAVYELQNNEKSQAWPTYRKALGTDAAKAINKTRRIDGKYYFLGSIRSENDRKLAEALKAAGVNTVLYDPF